MAADRTFSADTHEAGARLTLADVRAVVRDVEDAKAAAIIATGATRDELREAHLYAEGYGDVVDRSGHPLTGRVAEIYEILTADEEEPDRDR